MVSSLRPKSLSEALEFRTAEKARPFAGGTDLMVRYRGYSGTLPKLEGPILFLDAVQELKEISVGKSEITIGAGATLTQMLACGDLPELIRRAVELIAAPGLRNRATMGGNVCNASPAGDSIPPLYVHEALVVLVSPEGERTLRVDEFLTGPGTTALADNEILKAFRVPLLSSGLTYYRKVGTRRANALSKLSAAGYAALEGGAITDFRFSVGAVAPTVVRLTEAEEMVRGSSPDRIDIDAVLEAAAPRIRPIDDQRSTADYRRQTALNALQEFLNILQK
jgi:xanthine dehydrogenase FAD-binding subunit